MQDISWYLHNDKRFLLLCTQIITPLTVSIQNFLRIYLNHHLKWRVKILMHRCCVPWIVIIYICEQSETWSHPATRAITNFKQSKWLQQHLQNLNCYAYFCTYPFHIILRIFVVYLSKHSYNVGYPPIVGAVRVLQVNKLSENEHFMQENDKAC